MYGIEKENLAETLSLLEKELDTLEIGMNTKMTLKNVRVIHDQLISASQRGKAFIITPQTYYALRLSYFTAAINGELELAEQLQSILNFFSERSLLIGDESHRNFDPMTQAIYGLGEYISLKEKEQSLLMMLSKPLFGMEPIICDDGRPLSEIALSKENGKGKPSLKEIKTIQKARTPYFALIF